MSIMLKGKNKTRAELVLEQMALSEANKQQTINLYPEEPEPNYYDQYRLNEAMKAKRAESIRTFQESVMKELAFQCLYSGIVLPVLENAYANDHHKQLAASSIVDFINEQDVYDMVSGWKYKNVYLAEFAQNIERCFKLITETAKDKLKEGLSEKDAYKIENEKIDDFIVDVKNIIPPDITKTIMNRVEDSINDFIADNKLNRMKVLEIYNKAKDQIAAADGQDPAIAESYLQLAKRKEREITEATTTVFGEMVKILMESVMKVRSLNESYTNEDGKINFEKVLGDVRTIYTFMEAMNTVGVIDVTAEYATKTLQSMRESLNSISNDEKLTPSGDSKQPKEITHGDGSGDDNNPSNDFVGTSDDVTKE